MIYLLNSNYITLNFQILFKWYSIAHISRKNILVKARYKTYYLKYLTIYNTSKTYYYYLKNSKFKHFLINKYKNFS